MSETIRLEDDIKQWTKEDYLKGAAPYEWLYAMRDNSFMMTRMKTLVDEAAKAVGVRNFASLWKAYLETQVNTGGKSLLVNVTEFSGQAMELKCGDYFCNDFGVKAEGAYGGITTVCSHPIAPTKRLVNIDTGEVKLEIAYKRGAWKHAIFDKATLSSARNITALSSCGIDVTSESAKDLVKYLAYLENENYNELPETKTVGRLGWVDGYGFSPYVDNLVYDHGGRYEDEFKSVHAAGSWEKWLEVATMVRAGDSIPCRIALAASFASVLVKKMNALPFITHLWGSVSGIGKSVAVILAASVWAYPEIGYYVKPIKATDVALEQLAAFCGNMPLCLDELQLLQQMKDFDRIIYSLCEGVGKARGAKTGGLQSVQRWSNAIITSGEQPITTANSKSGAVNRVIELECAEKLFPDARAAYEVLVRHYGHAGRRFVEALTASDDAMAVLHELQKVFYEQLIGKATDKQVLSASILLAADSMTDLLLFEDGHSLTADDLLPYLTTKAQSDTNRRAYEWILDTIASNPSRFSPSSYGEYTGECWGCVDEGRAYIIKSVFDRLMNEQGFSPASFLSWARKNDMIECSRTEKRMTKRKRIKGLAMPVWCVCLCVPGEDGTTLQSGDVQLNPEEAQQITFSENT